MLEVYTLEQAEKWDEITTSFKDYDVYFLSGYAKGFMLHGDGQPLMFYFHDENIRGINVVFKRDISFDKHFKGLINENEYFDLTSPYGYGGWLIEGEGSLIDLDKEYTAWCIENRIISEIVRFHPLLKNQDRVREIYDVLDLGKTISLDLDSEELIWENITSKNRNVIRKAIKNGVTIEHKIDIDTMKKFKEIYNLTMDKDDADDYYYFNDDFYHSIVEDLKDKADIFYATYDNKMIAASIILKTNKRLTYHFSGFVTEYGTLAATNLLLYEVAKWGSQNGYKNFHLGGGVGSSEDNLFKFKKSFYRGEGYQYSIGKKIFNQDTYDKLVFMRTSFEKENFFPKYRA